ncbi:MAG: hypothetical protein AMXMBFR33_16380 [Candidatus Xenobia bacterium]
MTVQTGPDFSRRTGFTRADSAGSVPGLPVGVGRPSALSQVPGEFKALAPQPSGVCMKQLDTVALVKLHAERLATEELRSDLGLLVQVANARFTRTDS